MSHTLKLLLALAVSFGLLATTSQAQFTIDPDFADANFVPSDSEIIIGVVVIAGTTIWLLPFYSWFSS